MFLINLKHNFASRQCFVKVSVQFTIWDSRIFFVVKCQFDVGVSFVGFQLGHNRLNADFDKNS